MLRRYQIILCTGASCRARGAWPGLSERLAQLDRDERGPTACGAADADARVMCGAAVRVHVAGYVCLGFCREGPNLLVRRLPDDAIAPGQPGMRDLDDSLHYWRVDAGVLERILVEHCGQDRSLPGRCKRY